MPKPLEASEPKSPPSWMFTRSDGLGLVGSRDRKTGKCVFPRVPDASPAACRYAPVELSSFGVLYSFTVIHPNPKTGQAPFLLGYVDFPEDARAFGRLELPGGASARIGMPVEVRVEMLAENGVNYHFIAAREENR